MSKYVIIILLSLLLTTCKFGNVPVGMITIKGSDTMLILNQLLAEEYMEKNPGISIYVYGGGSKTGINALAEGSADICATSRQFEPTEIKELANKYGSLGLSHIIAKDALSIFVHPDNTVKNFTMQQIKDIFTCKITNWKELGGENKPINPIIRPINSGTHLYFKQHVLSDEPYCTTIKAISATSMIIEAIRKDKYAIGYGGIGYGKDIFHAFVNDIEPSEKNVINDIYPISRYLYFYTINSPSGIVKDYIEWIISPEGQQVVKKAGFIPLWNISY